MKRLLCIVSLCCGVAFGGDDIISLPDFVEHVEQHRERVTELALTLKEEFPEHFGDVPDDLIRDYLALHDINKINTVSADPLRIAKTLLRFWGKNMDDLEGKELEDFQKVRHELNALDLIVALDFLQNRGLTDRYQRLNITARKLRQLEKIADCVDRAADPMAVKEFGRKPLGIKFLTDPHEVFMAKKVEKSFNEIFSRVKSRHFIKILKIKNCPDLTNQLLKAG